MKLKVCGMKYEDNILKVSELKPDYLGFIFYEKSSRNFDGNIPALPESIKKVGVFVNAEVDHILNTASKYDLDAIQLHGNETPEVCKVLKGNGLEVIKVFSIRDTFDFSILEPYEAYSDYFLFDTKGELPGGNGFEFDWDILKNYPSKKPFFLSGGIGNESQIKLKAFFESEKSKFCYAIDVNSKFEIEPGLKNKVELKKFKTHITSC